MNVCAKAMVNIASPNTNDAVPTKIFRRPVRSEHAPPSREAPTMTADMTSVAKKICRGISSAPLPIWFNR